MRLLIALTVSLALAAPASARTTLVGPDVPTTALYQSFIDTAQAPSPDISVPLVLRDCDEESLTCMTWVGGGVKIYYPDLGYFWTEPNRSDADRLEFRTLFLHEVGHVLDWAHRHDNGARYAWHRRKFMRVMGLEGRWWSKTDVAPGEEFADAYAYCATGLTPDTSPYEGYRVYHPTPRQYSAVCALIRSL